MPISPTSMQDVEAVIALDAQPVLRNLRITQCYHDLSRALAAVVGDANVNWCTFAAWASKTAGRFVRGELVAIFRDALQSDRQLADKLDHLNVMIRHINAGAPLGPPVIIEALKAPVLEVSGHITAGNLAVFAELGPLFAVLRERLSRDASADAGSLARLLDELNLRPGAAEEGGQSLLRSAVGHFYEAKLVSEPDRKAELILLANAQTGLHEQIRLQPAIAGSLQLPSDAILRVLLNEIVDGTSSENVRSQLRHVFENAARPLFSELNADVNRIWRQCVTRLFMTLRFPEGEIHLGKDLRTSRGQKLFSPALQTIELAELRSLLTAYKADGGGGLASGAADWADIPERMHFILTLFRARQQDRRLFEQPFSAGQQAEISAGRIPAGAL